MNLGEWEARALTLAIEVPLVLGLARAAAGVKDRRHLARLAVVAVAMSLITHPFAWALNQDARALIPHPRARLLLIEALVALIEGLLLWRWGRLDPRLAFALGALVNAASFGLGIVLYRWG